MVHAGPKTQVTKRMFNLENVLLGLLVLDALALIVLVLIQQGKGADVGAAFGSGGANTMFGSAGSGSFLSRTTTWLSVGFFLISFGLAYTAKERAASVGTLGIPQVSAPQIDSPEVPAVDVPSLDVPSVDVPSVDVPSVDVPSVGGDALSADVPSVDVPAVNVPSDLSGTVEGAATQAVEAGGVALEGADGVLDSVVPDLPDGAQLQNSLESIESNLEDAVESVDPDVPDF